MELRKTQEETNELAALYQQLQRDERLRDALSELTVVEGTASKTGDNDQDASTTVDDTTFLSARHVLDAIESLMARLEALEPTIQRFQRRLEERDAVTNKPRYGPQTAQRVQAVSSLYQALQINIAVVDTKDNNGESSTVLDRIKRQAQDEQDELQQEKQRQAQEEAAEQERLQQEEQQRRQQEEAGQLEVERREQERIRIAQQERQAQRDAIIAQERVERAWANSIPKGIDSVREYVQVLLESTADDAAAQQTAFRSLHTIISQIVAHPEDDNFCRIRRSHEQFQSDISRHDGGKEILIAAGFVLRTIDDVPCFVAQEPNLETDMDAWTEWYDLLKATLQVLQEQL